MQDASTPASQNLSIAAVERDTGIGKDTLRVWEKRYGFPQPVRDALGERAYPPEQVVRLRLLKRLMDRGMRPGKLAAMSMAELQQLATGAPGDSHHPEALLQEHPQIGAYLDLVARHEIDDLKLALAQSLVRVGMRQFLLEVIAPMTRVVGDYWASGRFAVFEEHLYTEAVQNVLRHALATLPAALVQRAARPRVLLTTPPHEAHSLGLLMAEAMFAIEGAHCLSLGVQTPVPEIAAAARMHGSDAVALSLSASFNPNRAAEALRDLAAQLPDGVALWAGGANSALARASLEVPGLEVLQLVDVADTVARWRARQAA